MYRMAGKRLLSVILSLCGLLVCCIPMLIISIFIKKDSKGPILFKQKRLGKNQEIFTIYKFRTMCEHAYEIGGVATKSNDERITKVGSVLRRTSLDELPQIFNILIGNMAIIGPRPILAEEFEDYKCNTLYSQRYDVLPGMFCTVDVKYRSSSDRELQFKMDAEYVKKMNLVLDIRTFISVIAPVVHGKNVYREEIDSKENG